MPSKRKIIRKTVVVSSPTEIFGYLDKTGVKVDELVKFFYSDEQDAEMVADGAWARDGSEWFQFTVYVGDHYSEICEAIKEEFEVVATKFYGPDFHGGGITQGSNGFSTYNVN
jgi:hypothetical protein